MQPSRYFSQYARRAMMQARQCAYDSQHRELDTSHLLVGILRAEGSLGEQVLTALHMRLDTTRHAVGLFHPKRLTDPTEPIPMTPALRATITLAVEEARRLAQSYIGTEHLLLGLCQCQCGTATDILQANAIRFDELARQVEARLAQGETEAGLQRTLRMARLSELLRLVIRRATMLAQDMKQEPPCLPHLVMALVQETRSPAGQILRTCGLDDIQLAWDIASGTAFGGIPLEMLVDEAIFTAEEMGSHYTGTDHLVLVLAHHRKGIRLLKHYRVDLPRLSQEITCLLRRA